MEQISKISSRWQALTMAISSQNITPQDKLTLQTIKAQQSNMSLLQKVAIYGFCTMGVIKYQHSPLVMLGLCSGAAMLSLASNYYLSSKSWEKSSKIIKNVTGYREDFNMRPDDYKRMEKEMEEVRKGLEMEGKNADEELVND